MNPNQFLWVEKYRPQTIDDCILDEQSKKAFKDFVAQGQIPNLLLTGGPGVGKTTVARALCKELDMEYMFINGSEEGNIDTLRTKIKNFASTVSLNDNPKVIIIDEADYLNAQSTQPALRGVIEMYADNCRFILTCNYENKIIEPLHSRLSRFNFALPDTFKVEAAKQLFKSVKNILDEEKIKYDPQAVIALIKKYFPDFRKIVNELQRYSVSGTIDAGILVNLEAEQLNALVKSLKDKDFTVMRKWVGEHPDADIQFLSRHIYDHTSDLIEPASVPGLIITIDEYLYKNAFVADKEINLVAMLTEIMSGTDFK